MTLDLIFDSDRRKRSISQPSCFSVKLLPDDRVEFDETFELQLSTEDSDIALFPNTTTITIVNNDCKIIIVYQCMCEKEWMLSAMLKL